MRLLAGPIFAGAHEDCLKAGRHSAADVGFRIVADHDDMLLWAPHALDGELEKGGGGLAEDRRGFPGSIFQRRDERTGVEAELTVAVEEIPIFRECEKLGAMDKLPVGLVQIIIAEAVARVADHDGLDAAWRQTGKILAKVRVHDQQGRKIFLRQQIACNACRREDVLGCDLESKAHEILNDDAPWTARRIGDKLQRHAQFPDMGDCVERARKSPGANADNAVYIEENAFDGLLGLLHL